MKKEIGKEKVLEGEVKRKMSCTFLVGRVLVGNNKEDKTQDSRFKIQHQFYYATEEFQYMSLFQKQI